MSVDTHTRETEWSNDGTLLITNTYLNGRKDGICTRHTLSGMLVLRQNYKDGKQHGECDEWYPDGGRKKNCRYVNDVLDGYCVTWWPDGMPNWQCHYKMGVPVGFWNQRGCDGKINELTEFDQSGMRVMTLIWDRVTRKCTIIRSGICPELKYGYKKLMGEKICKLLILGDNNEHRGNIVNPLTAKYRCSKVIVLEIYDMFTKKPVEKGASIHCHMFVYNVGEMKETDYDRRAELDCAPGIHYFNTEECAFMWQFYNCGVRQANWTGLYKHWGSNGRLQICGNLLNGERHGPWTLSYEFSGAQSEILEYTHGKRNGPCLKYNTQMGLYEQGSYKDDKKVGQWEYISEKVYKIHHFVDGVLEGPWYTHDARDPNCIVTISGQRWQGKMHGKFEIITNNINTGVKNKQYVIYSHGIKRKKIVFLRAKKTPF